MPDLSNVLNVYEMFCVMLVSLLFLPIIRGGFIKGEREEIMIQCFVNEPEGVLNSTLPC